MASTPVINLRKGHAVRYNGEVWIVSSHEHKTQSRGGAHIQMSLRNVANRKVANLRLNSGDNMDSVMLERVHYEYSYHDSVGHHFLHTETFEDVVVPQEIINNIIDYLIEGQQYTILFADGAVADVELPASMEMGIREAPEGVKGDSANNNNKAVVMETGLVVQAPLFVGPEDRLIIKTDDGSYVSRA